MKKRKRGVILLLALLALMVIPLSLSAQKKEITVNQLPKNAIAFLTKSFDVTQIVKCAADNKGRSFDVNLSDGTEIEFDMKGEWKEIENEKAPLSKQAMSVLPLAIGRYMTTNYPNTGVSKLERDKNGYEVTLKTMPQKTELKFAKDGTFKKKEMDK